MSYALAYPERVSALVYVAGTGIGPEADWRTEFEDNLLARLGEHPERLTRRRELTGGPRRTAEEEREGAALQWPSEFEDRERALEHAERMATPWFGSNVECHRVLNAEARSLCGTPALEAACQALDVPVLIADGARGHPAALGGGLTGAGPAVRVPGDGAGGRSPAVGGGSAGFREAAAAGLGPGA
ncbi:hypothetical protein [Streptomyces azureus]|uniref:Putative Alpha/beta hydrolase fold protein n=1 Tax=Streptomyces azureus TaxID=146537 RepID=A0A0K8PUL7_STRAJ|nr:hypothetical protein [Streptomyces azureus]GAP51388.1 putative Alpha/beta hydrolase fold protein [Streptomyces azureus]